jgi:CBS domain-containing protein
MTSTAEKKQPAFASLSSLRVRDAMHLGMVACPPDAPLRTVARLMATHRVHAVLVDGRRRADWLVEPRWGVISDVDLLSAAAADDLEQTAAAAAKTPAFTVMSDAELSAVARLMLKHRVSHVFAIDPHSERPIGVLSTLDIARALAGFPERHPQA